MRKQQSITFRVTDDEYEMIKEKAKAANLTMTRFIVECCMEKKTNVVNRKGENRK